MAIGSIAFAYINHRYVRLPMSIGLMLMSLFISIFILILEMFGVSVSLQAHQMVTGIDFSKVLLYGMLGLLLFAGALHVNLDDLAEHRLEISIFSTISINNYQVEVMITLALVIGGYALGMAFHISAPLAIVVAGIFIGNHGRRMAMSEATRKHLDTFWELVDAILNALLYVLIGLEVLVLTLRWDYLMAGVLAVPIALAARFITIGGPVIILKRWRLYTFRSIIIITWAGLRGGISVALALSLPAECQRELILTMTYVVVAFSVLVQGLTLKKLIRKQGYLNEL